jgi:alginate O-acetyltransferase complex protein AlgI
MLFTSVHFAYLFVITYVLYVVLPHRWQNRLLLVSSYVFYAYWDVRLLSLLVFVTLFNFTCGIGIGRGWGGRRLLWFGICVNLGVLFTFKYFNFFIDSLNLAAGSFGSGPWFQVERIVLPLGISFFTFQAISYLVDIRQGVTRPTYNLLDFALFKAFFPQLVAGPIERATTLLPQIAAPRTVTPEKVRQGIWLLLLGYFKKLVIADNLAAFTRPVFERPGEQAGLPILIGLVAFAFQIYADFSGYTDIARGLAKLFGIDFVENFRRPYFAESPSDFWRRWHISLSSWLRDYLYIQLGGNRGGRWLTYRNLMLTMLLGGLWHGAAWNFVAWGGYHGLLLIGQRLLGGPVDGAERSTLVRFARAALFFPLTCAGWLLFAVKDLADVSTLAVNLFHSSPQSGGLAALTILVFAGPLLVAEALAEYRGWRAENLPPWLRLLTQCVLFATILLCASRSANEFIYFQF